MTALAEMDFAGVANYEWTQIKRSQITDGGGGGGYRRTARSSKERPSSTSP
jgi:hypothetical protein